MNFYKYDLSTFEKIKSYFNYGNNEFLREGNASIHLYFSHDCNIFLKDIDKLQSNQNYDYDFYIVPFVIWIKPSKDNLNYKIFQKMIDSLEHFKKYPKKHIFFFVGDDSRIPNIFSESILFMHSCHKNFAAFPLHFTSSLIGKLRLSQSINLARYDVSFQGRIKAHKCRSEMISCMENSKMIKFFSQTPSLPKYPLTHKRPLIDSYIDSINNSKFVLCPRGVGLNSIRFFEVIAAGRIPVLISDNVKLPQFVDWNNLIVHVPEKNISKIEYMIKKFQEDHDLEKVSVKLKKVWDDCFSNFENFLNLSFNNLSNSICLEKITLL